MTQLCSFGTVRRCNALLLLGSVLALACGSTDDGKLLQPFRISSGDGAAGAAGSDGNGGSGGSGSGGTLEQPDAGGDAASDASSPNGSCRIGSLEDYCADGFACPDSPAAARLELHEVRGIQSPQILVQRACSAADGAARISVGADFTSSAMNYIYDAQTRQLVGVQVLDDLGCTTQGLTAHGFGNHAGYYGEESPQCSFVIPAACNLPDGWLDRDAGAPPTTPADAGADAGPLYGDPYECILVP